MSAVRGCYYQVNKFAIQFPRSIFHFLDLFERIFLTYPNAAVLYYERREPDQRPHNSYLGFRVHSVVHWRWAYGLGMVQHGGFTQKSLPSVAVTGF